MKFKVRCINNGCDWTAEADSEDEAQAKLEQHDASNTDLHRGTWKQVEDK